MVLRFQMVRSGAEILAWLDLPDNNQCNSSDTANVELCVVFKQPEQVPNSPLSLILLLLQQDLFNL